MTTPWRTRKFALPTPCEKDCPQRKGGCQVGCKKWAEYVSLRDDYYAQQEFERTKYIHTPSEERRYRRNMRRGRKGGHYGNP